VDAGFRASRSGTPSSVPPAVRRELRAADDPGDGGGRRGEPRARARAADFPCGFALVHAELGHAGPARRQTVVRRRTEESGYRSREPRCETQPRGARCVPRSDQNQRGVPRLWLVLRQRLLRASAGLLGEPCRVDMVRHRRPGPDPRVLRSRIPIHGHGGDDRILGPRCGKTTTSCVPEPATDILVPGRRGRRSPLDGSERTTTNLRRRPRANERPGPVVARSGRDCRSDHRSGATKRRRRDRPDRASRAAAGVGACTRASASESRTTRDGDGPGFAEERNPCHHVEKPVGE
jgi:hypothetical protein